MADANAALTKLGKPAEANGLIDLRGEIRRRQRSRDDGGPFGNSNKA
jgi:hypothetical protein